jgi:hypothetical protein
MLVTSVAITCWYLTLDEWLLSCSCRLNGRDDPTGTFQLRAESVCSKESCAERCSASQTHNNLNDNASHTTLPDYWIKASRTDVQAAPMPGAAEPQYCSRTHRAASNCLPYFIQ